MYSILSYYKTNYRNHPLPQLIGSHRVGDGRGFDVGGTSVGSATVGVLVTVGRSVSLGSCVKVAVLSGVCVKDSGVSLDTTVGVGVGSHADAMT